MAVTNGYCTVAQLREHLGDDDSELDVDVLERAISAASREIDRFCDRRFWQDANVVARTYQPDDGWSLWADDISTRTGLLVKTDEDLDGTFETTWTEGTHYRLGPDNVEFEVPVRPWERLYALTSSRTFPWDRAGRRTVQVTAKFGWPAVPDEVTQACILRSVAIYKRVDAPFGVIGGGFDGSVVRISRFADPDVERLLKPFVRRRHRSLDFDPQAEGLFHGGRR